MQRSRSELEENAMALKFIIAEDQGRIAELEAQHEEYYMYYAHSPRHILDAISEATRRMYSHMKELGKVESQLKEIR